VVKTCERTGTADEDTERMHATLPIVVIPTSCRLIGFGSTRARKKPVVSYSAFDPWFLIARCLSMATLSTGFGKKNSRRKG